MVDRNLELNAQHSYVTSFLEPSEFRVQVGCLMVLLELDFLVL